MAWTGVHGADVPVGAIAYASPVHANGRVALFQAEGPEEKESRQESASEGEEEKTREEKGDQEETPPLTQLGTHPRERLDEALPRPR